MDDSWTLAQIKEAGYYLWATCHPDHVRGHIFMLDLDALIAELGPQFNVVGTRLSERVTCPHCGSYGSARVGVGNRRAEGSGPVIVRLRSELLGPHGTGHGVSIEEATRARLERNQRERQSESNTLAREDERVKAAIEKARAAKERRRRNNPYDFS